MATWATAGDVYTATRRDVTEEGLAVAQSIIEDLVGTDVDFDDAGISNRNRRYLMKAVCWQAVWVDAHPDILEVMDVHGVHADGVSAQYKTDTAAFLSPLARRCLNRVSWFNGPIKVRGARRAVVDVGNRDDAVRDDNFLWSGLELGSPRITRADPMSQRAGQVWT